MPSARREPLEESALAHDDPGSLAPPTTIGPYRILHQVGAGVLGPVFRAHDPEGDHEVAVKVFRLDLTPEQAADLAQALSRLCLRLPVHPRIVACHAAGLTGSLAWLAQEYVGADALDARIRRRTAGGLRQALPLLEQVADALDVAAAAGVHHGALHPRDILISTTGDLRVTGLGVVEALIAVGAPATVRRPYAAPERVARSATPPDPAFDVFSLGAVAVEMLTGRRPFGTGAAAAGFVSGVADGVDADRCRTTLARALAESPAARFPTAGAFCRELSTALGESVVPEPHASRPPGPAEHEPAPTAERHAPPAAAGPDSDGEGPVDARASIAMADAERIEAALTSEPSGSTGGWAPFEPDAERVAEAAARIEAGPDAIDDTTLEAFPSELASERLAAEAETGLRTEPVDTSIPVTPLDVTDAAVGVELAAETLVGEADLEMAGEGGRFDPGEPAAVISEPEDTIPAPARLEADAPMGEAPAGLLTPEEVAPTMSRGEENVALATLWTAAVFVIGAGIGLAGGYLLWGRASPASGPPAVTATEQPIAPSAPQRLETEEPVLPTDRPARRAAAPTTDSSASGTGGRGAGTAAPGARLGGEERVARAEPPRTRAPGTSTPAGRSAIEVVSRPAGARVYIDGHLVGTTPYRAPAIPAGSRLVRLELDGYRDWATTVSLNAGRASRVAASLELTPPR